MLKLLLRPTAELMRYNKGKFPKTFKKQSQRRGPLVCAMGILTACITAFSNGIMLHLTFFTDRDKLTKYEIQVILHLTFFG